MGRSIRSIADELEISKSQVQRDIEKELKVAAENRQKLAIHLIDLELAKLDALEEKAWNHIDDGSESAIGEARRLSESRRKLLGLDQPEGMDDDSSLSDLVAIIKQMRKEKMGDNEGN